jgi:hypothetical protein
MQRLAQALVANSIVSSVLRCRVARAVRGECLIGELRIQRTHALDA